MNLHSLTFAAAGLAIGLTLGFVFANQSFRNDLQPNIGAQTIPNSLPTNNQPASTAGETLQANDSNESERLSNEELRRAIEQADSRIGDSDLQRRIGLALAQYARVEQSAQLLPAVVRILERANSAREFENDRVLQLALADALLLDYQETQNQNQIDQARRILQKLEKNDSSDVDLQVKIGLTHQLARPPDQTSAVNRYRQALKLDAKHRPALKLLTKALIALKQIESAKETLDKLKTLDPVDSEIADLEIQLAQTNLLK